MKNIFLEYKACVRTEINPESLQLQSLRIYGDLIMMLDCAQ